ncbi:MAG: hypothetical protein ABW090_01200 [Sedimenticola sp.]
MTSSFQYLFNDWASQQRAESECLGMCHGNPGMGDRELLNQRRTSALINSALSGTGAVLAAPLCSSGVGCGLTVVLAGDSARQMTIAATGVDPVYNLARNGMGLSEIQSSNVAVATDFVTATVSIHGVVKGLALRSTSTFTAGALGEVSVDVISTINTINQLNYATGTGP